MWRFILAIQCFFLVLFARRLPADAARLLPPPSPEQLGALPPREAEVVGERPADAPAPRGPTDEEKRAAERQQIERGAILLLGVLQREGRLLDFLEEDIDGFPDAQIGAGVRDIHRGCKKALDEHLKLEPVLRDADNAT